MMKNPERQSAPGWWPGHHASPIKPLFHHAAACSTAADSAATDHNLQHAALRWNKIDLIFVGKFAVSKPQVHGA